MSIKIGPSLILSSLVVLTKPSFWLLFTQIRAFHPDPQIAGGRGFLYEDCSREGKGSHTYWCTHECTPTPTYTFSPLKTFSISSIMSSLAFTEQLSGISPVLFKLFANILFNVWIHKSCQSPHSPTARTGPVRRPRKYIYIYMDAFVPL